MIICYTVPGIWHMKDVVIFSFWAIFCPFTPLTCPKNRNWKKLKKKSGDIIILHKCIKNHDQMLYCSWDMAHDGCNCHFSFWAFFFFPFTNKKSTKKNNSPKNQNFKKMKKKKAWRYHHFTHVYQKLWLDDVWFLRYGARLMDGRTDGKSNI